MLNSATPRRGADEAGWLPAETAGRKSRGPPKPKGTMVRSVALCNQSTATPNVGADDTGWSPVETAEHEFRGPPKPTGDDDMVTKKTDAKKSGSPFGPVETSVVKTAVARPVKDVTKEKKTFVPSTDKDLADIQVAAKKKEEAKRSSSKNTKKPEVKAEVKPVAEVKTKKPGGIGNLARELIAKDLDPEKILAEVKKKFPDSAFNPKHIAWYRADMVRREATK